MDNPSPSSTQKSSLTSNLHDQIALGEFVNAIISSAPESNDNSNNTNKNSDDEILRCLPLFIRLLTPSRALSSFPSISNNTEEVRTSSSHDTNNIQQRQKYIDEIVSYLEIIAVTYPQAENMELFMTYFIPKVISNIMMGSSKIMDKSCDDKGGMMRYPKRRKQQLVRKRKRSCYYIKDNHIKNKTNNHDEHESEDEDEENDQQQITYVSSQWDTAYLQSIIDLLKMKREQKESLNNNNEHQQHEATHKDDKNLAITSSPELDNRNVNESSESIHDTMPTQKHINTFIETIEDEDSPEFTIRKVLVDLISLVISSLESIQLSIVRTSTSKLHRLSNQQSSSKHTVGEYDDENDDDGDIKIDSIPVSHVHKSNCNSVQLKLNPDSILIESISTSKSAHTKLSATLVSILHHIPIIRYEHVANALCRASAINSFLTTLPATATGLSLPQCAHIIQRLAANAPSSSCLLLRGCINAYHYATTLLGQGDLYPVNCDNKGDDKGDINLSSDNDNIRNTNINIGDTIRIIKSAKESVVAISKLSRREASHVITMLNQSHAMPDIMIALMMEYDPTALLATLFEDLIREKKSVYEEELYRSSDSCCTSTKRSMYMRNGLVQNHKQKGCSISDALSNVQRSKAWIIECLKNDLTVACKVRHFLSVQFDIILDKLESSCPPVWGKIALHLQVYALLIHSIGIGAGSSVGSGSTYVTKVMYSITNICIKCQNYNNKFEAISSKPARSRADECAKMAISACILTCINFPPIADGRDTNIMTPSMIACIKCLTVLLEWNPSFEVEAFIFKIIHYIKNECASQLKCILIENLFGQLVTSSQSRDSREETIHREKVFIKFCQWSASLIRHSDNYDVTAITPSNISVLIQKLKYCPRYGKEYDPLIRNLLNDANQCEALFEMEELFQLITTAASVISRRPEPIIPILLPLSIESLVVLSVKKSKTEQWESKLGCQMIIQLIYAFTFLEHLPDSPFAIDTSTLPLKSVLQLLLPYKRPGSKILKQFIMRYSPQLLIECLDYEPIDSISIPSKSKFISTVKNMGDAIRQHLTTSKPFGTLEIEKIFINTRGTNSPSCVDVEAALALLESVNDPIHFLTYKKLCEDPLMLMKCSVKVWIDDGLRRIALGIMQRQLDTNEQMIKEYSITPEVASEYLISRDAIVLRGWLAIVSALKLGNLQLDFKALGVNCPLLTSMIRMLIVKRPGLVALMVKQLAPAEVVDWLVINVPELRSESVHLIDMLESGTLSPVERLYVADASFRIIVFNSRYEVELHTLAISALSALVNSFHVALGPFGIPVNIMSDQDGRDKTAICRTYVFRMISSITMVKSEMPVIRNEACLAISKFAGLCKSEMSLNNLSGTAAQRRKETLKDLWDALVRANNSLGGGAQL